MRGTKRQDAILKAIRALIPRAPMADFEPIIAAASAAKLKSMPPTIAAWLAIIAYIRHVHTDYDAMLGEDYDRDAARFFVRGDINNVLTDWGCQRQLSESEDEETPLSERAARRRP